MIVAGTTAGRWRRKPAGAIALGLMLAAIVLGAHVVLCAAEQSGGAQASRPASKPNVIFILADDLGYGELGCYGQKKIRTPNIDRLAAQGMRFTQFYAGAPVCAPSRCVLLTGKHLGHAYVRDNCGVPPEGQLPIPDEETTLAELLKQEGYATAVIGKWGLGPPGSTGDPNRQGFDFFFGYNSQGHAHNHYPTYLYRNEKKVLLDNPEFSAHQRFPDGLDANDPANYKQYAGNMYAPDLMIEEALGFIRRNKDRPFFLYFATTIPHLALQVPEDSLAEYLGKFPEKPYLGDRGYLPHYAPHACYAAMITRMDRDIGRMIALVDELGLAANTLVMFSSDNGPTHGRGGGPEGGVGGSDSVFFESSGPLSGLKGSVYEGGVRVPLIARWPGTIAPGATTEHIGAFYDVLPTVLDLLGRPAPAASDGLSFLPTLLGRGNQQEHEFLLWEFYGYGGQQAVRAGRWKGIRLNCYRDPAGPLMLFDLAADLQETRNVAAEHPEVVRRLENILQREHTDSPHWNFAEQRRPRFPKK